VRSGSSSSTKAFLPMIRAARGRVVFVGSRQRSHHRLRDTRLSQLVGEAPTAYRARDHGTLASVPGCIAKDSPARAAKPSRIGEARGASGNLVRINQPPAG
jgi:hypothetical protein